MGRLATILALIAVSATACLGGSAAATHQPQGATGGPQANLRVRVGYLAGYHLYQHAGTPMVRHTYTLTCDPAGGTMPDAAAACVALADLQHRSGGGCIGVLAIRGESSTAMLSGTFRHRRYRLAIDASYTWCGQPRPALRDLWVLSTFPCTVEVLREAEPGVTMTYPAWPRWAGCVTRAG